MRVLDEISLDVVAVNSNKDVIKNSLSRLFWKWFESNQYKVIHKVSILKIWKKSIRVRDLEIAFIVLFGPKP
jgi:hypothetical protein